MNVALLAREAPAVQGQTQQDQEVEESITSKMQALRGRLHRMVSGNSGVAAEEPSNAISDGACVCLLRV